MQLLGPKPAEAEARFFGEWLNTHIKYSVRKSTHQLLKAKPPIPL